MLSFTDTLTGKKLAFTPRDEGQVSIYWCGPTVYDHPHLGHARSALALDILHRYLEWRGYEVTVASNITDIDDNIIKRANREGRTEPDVAAEYEKSYVDQMTRLGIAAPDHRPHATQYVEQMIAVVTTLLDRDMAYVVPGNGVYYRVARLADYGALVHRHADELRESAQGRIEVDERKEDPLDFALWKAAKPGEPTWPSPWGDGRPGWHIECVAMAMELLGENFDIHGGGDDLAFPHHENERAEAAGTGRPFARYWVHNGMVQINNEKMSKSLGNFVTLIDVLDEFDPRALRLLVLQTHYRKTMEINPAGLAQATAALDKLDALARRAHASAIPPGSGSLDAEFVTRFRSEMDDDLGTPAALAVVFDAVREANAAIDTEDSSRAADLVATVSDLAGALGLSIADPAANVDAEIDALVAARQVARKAKDFAEADRVRDELTARGILVEDTPSGPIWRRAGG